jgi:Asp/Glu/hydantoin racemase
MDADIKHPYLACFIKQTFTYNTEVNEMAKRLALIHTASFLSSVFGELSKEIMPEVHTFNIVDESLIGNTIAAGKLTANTSKRVAQYIQSAEEAGADMVLVTCSSIGSAVEAARPFVNIPVLRIDEPMAHLAVQTGNRIGVIATLPTTLEPTIALVQNCAAAQGKTPEIISHLCEGAFQAVVAGDAKTHDIIVANGLRELMPRVDVVVLAQASMARVVDTLSDDEKTVPILSSPRSGIEATKAAIEKL